MNAFLMRALLALTLATSMVVLTPRSASAAAPTCVDMSVGVPHNTALPIFVECSGGTGTGSPDILVIAGPSNGALSVAAGQTSTDQWVIYTPTPGHSGPDSFTYRGVSPGSGSGGADEVGPLRTVQLRVGPGTAPRCRSASETVSYNDGTTTPTPVFLTCDSGGDPITGYQVVQGPEHGSLDTAALATGLVRYTPAADYSGADSLTFRATSACGAASCQSAVATVALTVLEAQVGPAGPPGEDGEDGEDGQTVVRLFVAASAARVTATSGRRVPVPFVVTTTSQVRLDVYRDGRRVARAARSVAAGRRTIIWNGRIGSRVARPGRYRLVLTAAIPGQRSVDRSLAVLTRRR